MMKTTLNFLPCLLLLAVLSSCAQEQIGEELVISGEFAQISNSGLTSTILEFNNGEFIRWESNEPYPFAEKKIWHCNAEMFKGTTMAPYSIIDGIISIGGVNKGRIELVDGVLHYRGETYGVLEGFQDEAYSRINVNPARIDLTYAAENVQFPVDIERPIPGGILSATTTAEWISNLRVKDGSLLFNTTSTKVNRSANVTLSYTHAEDLILAVIQAPSTFIRFADPDKTIGYEASYQSIAYGIDNPLTSSALTVNCTDSWIRDLEIHDGQVVFNVDENNTGNERKAYFYFQYEGAPDVMYTLTQKWDAATIITSPTSAEFEYTGGQGGFTFEIQNPRQETQISVQSQASWISNVTVNDNAVTYRVAENNSVAQRSGKIKLIYGDYTTVEFPVIQNGKPVVSLTLNKNSLSLSVGNSETLIVTVDPSDAPLTWASDNTSVATVSQAGIVAAIGIGTTTIRVSADNGKAANCVVTVTTPVTQIILNRTSISMNEEEEQTLIATILPESANQLLTWTSSNESVATINQNGTVTALSNGSTTIKAKAQDGSGIYTECKVHVCYSAIAGEAVDLGLSVKWSSWNLGATKPEEYGDYFAWGETDPKDNYDWSTYWWCNGSRDSLRKYFSNSYGYHSIYVADGMTSFKDYDYEDDAARKALGSNWRIPTDAEWTELRENCTWTWTGNYNGTGVAGRIVTSDKTGYTDKSIFLPAAGYRSYAYLYSTGSYGLYWSSRRHDYSSDAWRVRFDSNGVNRLYDDRYNGFSVRPVTE